MSPVPHGHSITASIVPSQLHQWTFKAREEEARHAHEGTRRRCRSVRTDNNCLNTKMIKVLLDTKAAENCRLQKPQSGGQQTTSVEFDPFSDATLTVPTSHADM